MALVLENFPKRCRYRLLRTVYPMLSGLLIVPPILPVLSDPRGGTSLFRPVGHAGKHVQDGAVNLWSVVHSPANECRLVKEFGHCWHP